MAANRLSIERGLAVDEPSVAEPLLSLLAGDLLRAIGRLLADEDRLCFRLACTTTRAHCERPVSSAISRASFLRTRSLAAYACDELAGFVLADEVGMLALAARVGCVAVLAELTDARGCGGGHASCVCGAAASHGQLEALVWLHGRGCPWDCNSAGRWAGAARLAGRAARPCLSRHAWNRRAKMQ